MKIRKPAVSGHFYERSPGALENQIKECFLHPLGPGSLPSADEKKSAVPAGRQADKEKVIGLLCPHAGLAYSGHVAAHGYFKLSEQSAPETVVVLGPNHRGMGKPLSVDSSEAWEMPFGAVPVAVNFAHEVCEAARKVFLDSEAHQFEHSIEVQVPFLQTIFGGKFTLLPISMLDQTFESGVFLGEILAQIFETKDVLFIASSDMTHYESASLAKEKDMGVIAAITQMEPKKMWEEVRYHQVSMCGPGPTVAMLTACKKLGAKKTALLKYATSGDVTGTHEQVVGYASVAIEL